MKVLICFPPIISSKGTPTLGQNRQFQWFTNPAYLYPVVPAYAATLLNKEGFTVRWLDCIAEQISYSEFFDIIRKEKPDILAIETKTPVIRQEWKMINELKKNMVPQQDLIIVLFGDHVTALPGESFQNSQVDFVLRGGDYDFLLLNLCQSLKLRGSQYSALSTQLEPGIWYRHNGESRNTGDFQLNHDLDSLPLIDRELTKWHLYKEYNFRYFPYTYIMSGRDCPWHKCKFCAWTTLYPHFRIRSVAKVLDEIGFLIEKYGIKEIFDDTGTFPEGGWLEEFCRGMMRRGYHERVKLSCNFRADFINNKSATQMKKAGFRLLKLGLESGNQHTLDRINKGIRVEQIAQGCRVAKSAGLDVHLTMIVGYPWETKQEALNTFRLAKRLMTKGFADILQATILVPYPGTPLYAEAIKNNWFRISPSAYEYFDMSEPVLKTPMASKEVRSICNRIYKDIFLSPPYIMRQLSKIHSFRDISFYLSGVKAVFGHIKDFSRA